MDYVIAGVSGHTGKVAAETLISAGQRVRVVVRDAAKGDAWKRQGADVAVADLGDAAALAKALAGAKGAYLLLPPNMGAADFGAYQKATGAAIAKAVRDSKIPHVVFLSSVGAQHADGTGPIKALHPLEAALRAIPGTVATFIRAAYFMENLGGSLGALAQGILPTFQPTNLAFEMIATKDIGALAAATLLDHTKQSSVIELGGPRKYSFDDAAAALARITGKPVTAHDAGIEAMVPTLTGFGFTPGLAALYREMTEGLLSGRVAFEGTHRTKRGTTELETVLRGLLGQ